MTKKIIAIALASAFVAPAALADVQLYGIVSAGVEHVRATGAENVAEENQYKGRMRIADHTSRIGFKGSEDLGGGLKAHWQIEQGVKIDEGGSSAQGFANRTSFIGLAGDFGDVRLGRHEDAYRVGINRLGLDVMASTTADNHWGNTAMFGRAGGRRDNTAIYMSPKFSGFDVIASYSLDENRVYDKKTGQRTEQSVVGASVNYNADGLKATLAFNRANDRGGMEGNNVNAWTLGASYKFGDTMLGAAYERLDVDLAMGYSTKQDAWTLAATHQMGAVGLKASYTQRGKLKVDGGDSDNQSKANQWVLGVDYALSKRTKVFGYATRITNKENSAANFGVNKVAVLPGADPQAIGVGLSHAF